MSKPFDLQEARAGAEMKIANCLDVKFVAWELGVVFFTYTDLLGKRRASSIYDTDVRMKSKTFTYTTWLERLEDTTQIKACCKSGNFNPRSNMSSDWRILPESIHTFEVEE